MQCVETFKKNKITVGVNLKKLGIMARFRKPLKHEMNQDIY